MRSQNEHRRITGPTIDAASVACMNRSIRSYVLMVCAALAVAGCATAPPPAIARDEVPLPFSDFFVRPVGPRGTEPTATLLALEGRRVLVRGFMVREEEPYPGFFMFVAFPVTIAERADGPADSLPPATLFVHLPEAQRDQIAHFVPVELELAGTLELGAKEETSGRISYVRLRLDDLNDARNLPKEQTE